MYDLGKQFQMDMENAKASPRAVLQGQRYRFTVLSERLIRMEYHPEGLFIDAPSQFAIFRNFEVPSFDVKQDATYLVVRTKYFEMEYQKEKPFVASKVVPMNNLKVTITGTDKVWYYPHPEARNFSGVFTSFDGTNKDRIAGRSLYSLDGFVSFDDSKSYLFDEAGLLNPRDGKGLDIYLFVYQNDFKLCLGDYFKLTGYPPLIPRYALGNWWCKNTDYNDESLLELAHDFLKNDIPLSVLLLDKDWHIREVPDKKDEKTGKVTYKKIKSGFTFHPELFPNPDETIQKLHDLNIRVGLQVDPVDGIYPIEPFYEKAREYLSVPENQVITFDPLNPKFMDVYMKFFLHGLESKGVDFFWNDYQNTKDGTFGLWTLNHYHFLDLARTPEKRGMLLARPVGPSCHRYPILYSGETESTWEMLRKIPKLHQAASNAGISWWSHDVGGNHGGIEDPELYIRNVQLGVFSPILRFHAGRSKYYKREPWRWDIKTLSVVDDYLRLRHRLIPYLYTEAYQYYQTGVPIVRPLYHEVPWVYDDDNYQNQYYFGTEFMVAPILSKKDVVMNRTVHRFYMPEGIWYDFTTGKKFPGNKRYVSFYRDEDYPVFVRSGGIIPLSNKSNENNVGNPSEVEIHIFPGQNNTFYLYEDDGVTSLYRDGYYLKTQIDYNYLPSNYTLIIRSVEGKSGLVPEYRDYKIRFRNTKQADDVICYFDSSSIPTTSYVEETDFIVEIKHVPSVGQLSLNCKGKDIEIDAIRLINDDIESILMDLQIDTYVKERISSIMFSELPLKKKRIEVRKLKKHGLSRDYIQLFLKLLEYISEI